MIYADRQGKVMQSDTGQDRFLRVLYGTTAGRLLLKPLTMSWVSVLAGKFMDSPVSARLIPGFIKKNGIQMNDYEEAVFASYNAFFKRQIKKECRPVAGGTDALISPCDGKLSVYPITKKGNFFIKNTPYTVHSLLRSKCLADYYEGGTICIFRLTVDNYHRFCYPSDAKKSVNYHIPGLFHTVNPIANDVYPVYKENTREYCLLKTKKFKTVTMMEVGALMVGRIVNYHGRRLVEKGREKGCFEFGGSTVILLLKKDAVNLDSAFLEHTKKGYETIVKMGEEIGKTNE